MRIYLVQHGEAVDRETDPDRPLSAKGREDVSSIGRFLNRAGIVVTRIVHSGKTRARQSAEILSAELLKEGEPGVISSINPDDPVDQFAPKVNGWSEDTLVVGHLPFMAGFASQLLLGKDNPTIVAYQPGSVVCLERNEAGAWRIEWMVRPELVCNQ